MAETLGLIADTHVPDRSPRLHPQALSIFERARVSAILHAGDIAVPRVLAELETVAPVLAVRGNRDWFGFHDLPYHRRLTVAGARIGLTHGHGSWAAYLRDKVRFLLRGPQSFDYFMQRAISLMPDVDVLVFGHNHEPMVKEVAGVLVVNPGSACCQIIPGRLPTEALLHLQDGKARAEIVDLV
ncbi:MAG: YfcE family phosphodiesterase [Anaerolineales bacterium]